MKHKSIKILSEDNFVLVNHSTKVHNQKKIVYKFFLMEKNRFPPKKTGQTFWSVIRQNLTFSAEASKSSSRIAV